MPSQISSMGDSVIHLSPSNTVLPAVDQGRQPDGEVVGIAGGLRQRRLEHGDAVTNHANLAALVVIALAMAGGGRARPGRFRPTVHRIDAALPVGLELGAGDSRSYMGWLRRWPGVSTDAER